MKEKLEELYKAYLNEKLDLIFEYHKEKDKSKTQKNVKIIEKDGKYNIIDKNGNLLSETWFDEISDFNNGYARVISKRKMITKRGKLVVDTKMNLIDTSGRLVSEEWFEWVDDVFCNGYVHVIRNGKHNFVDRKGRLISEEWYDNVDDFYNGIAMIRKNAPHYDSVYHEIMPYKFDAIDRIGRRIFGNWS